MARGLSRQQKYNRTVSVLKKLARKYNGNYRDWVATGKYEEKPWEAWLTWCNASNGETFGMLQMRISGWNVEDWLDYNSDAFLTDSMILEAFAKAIPVSS